MRATESRERPDLPTLTESLPLDDAAVTAALAALKPPPSRDAAVATAVAPVDIELPFKVRAVDTGRAGDAAATARHRLPAPPVTTPFASLLDCLLDSGSGPYGLQVDVKHDHRVVGTWDIYLGPADPNDIRAPQTSAILYACVAPDGNPRETAAFLVLTHWWIVSADPVELDQLYEELTYAVLDRLDALMQARTDIAATMPPYVLFLVDGRQKKPRVFKAARLERAMLRVLGDGRAVPGLDLHVAHGRGTGVSPVSTTQPSDLSATELVPPDIPTFRSDSADDAPAKAEPPAEPVRRRAEEVFVAERLSEANLRWMRKGKGGGPAPGDPA